MLRSVGTKVAWVGRTASMVFGLALVMALVLGVASVAFAGNLAPLKIGSLKNVATKTTQLVGKVATGSAFVVKNPSGGSALGLQVNEGQAPITVDAEAGTATGLSADELDGKDSDAILPLLRAQRDNNPSFTSDVQSGNSAQMNTASLTAPTDGFFVISSSVDITHWSGTDTQKFTVSTNLNGTKVGAARLNVDPTNNAENVAPHTVAPVSAGEHTITLVADRFSGTGNWIFNRNNLSVMFVPASQGGLTDVPSGG